MAPSDPGVERIHPRRGQPSTAADVAERVVEAARHLGFSRVGFAPTDRFDEAGDRLAAWLDAGCHGEMAYLADSQDRADIRQLLSDARTLIVVVLPYDPRSFVPLRTDGPRGTIARYARGADYHVVLKAKLRQLAESCAEILGRPVLARPCVDTAPLLEREAASRAGVGFTGKNTMTIVPGVGTYTVLGELLLDVEVAAPAAEALPERCGACTACLDACPTQAFRGPYVLDARRCISYLTIELRGSIPRDLRPMIGDRVFGCDVCQEVCPFNAAATGKPHAEELQGSDATASVDLVELLELRSGAYRRLVRGRSLRRISRNGLARNAAVALGNSGDRRAVPALMRALGHPSEIVREHVAWALGALGDPSARPALAEAAERDEAATVRQEAGWALERLGSDA